MKKHYAWLLLLVTTSLLLSAAAYKINGNTPTATVNLSRMNVFFIGVDNPIEIKVDGIAPEKLSPTISGGSMAADTLGSGRFIVRVSGGTKATITVRYRQDDGTLVDCGTFEYRIKRMPDPVTYINAVKNDGVILKEDLQKITGVFTRMENFDFDGTFKPQSFSMSVIEDGEWKEYKAIGPECTPEMKAALQKCEEEDKILFHNVIAKGPDGTLRHVSCVSITVK